MSSRSGQQTSTVGIGGVDEASDLDHSHDKRGEKVDVIVIGAGVSGLFAALDLEAQGASVQIVEAQDRPGGRLRRESGGGLVLDVGGLQIGPEYDRIRAMADRTGVRLQPQTRGFGDIDMCIGDTLVSRNAWAASPANRLVGPEREIPPFLLEMRLLTGLSPLAAADVNWLDPALAAYDVSAAELMRRHGASEEAVRLVDIWANAPGLEHSSALHLFREAAALLKPPRPGAPLLAEAPGGLSQMPAAMADMLARPVRYDAEVVAVVQDLEGVSVRLASGKSLRAGHVICAAPLSAVKHIAFDPPLPMLQAQALAAAVYAPITQVHLRVLAPFWEADGLAPSLYTDGPLERILAVTGEQGVERMVVWLNGPGAAAADQYAPEDLMAYTLAEIGRLRPAAKDKLAPGFVYSWGANRFAGGIRHVMAPGDVGRYAATLTRPHGRILFAGEHARKDAPGLEGAAESGQLAAQTILAA